MRPVAKLIGTWSIALTFIVSVPHPAAAQAERTPPVTAGLLTGSCSSSTAMDVATAATTGNQIARFQKTNEWLSSIGRKTVLLSFIDTSERSTDGTENPDMSRRLLVFIQSMRKQYSSRGLEVALVDGTSVSTPDDGQRLVNFRFDHDLIDTPVLSGTAGTQALRELGVRCLPTTFLINPHGRITARWEGLVLPSTMAEAIAAIR